ncbi:acyl carrier protein [Lachnospiraceae bacterium 48-42]|jgi:acyl carrier protein|nr:acyl carrier protein [Dorea sp.]
MLEKLKTLISENLEINTDNVTESSSFKEDLGIDSLDLFELVMAMEEEFDIEIPSDDLENMSTVGDVIEYIESHK